MREGLLGGVLGFLRPSAELEGDVAVLFLGPLGSDLATLERVVFSSGEVAAAVQASTAVPGIFVPITLEDGGTYVDGGIVDPLPAPCFYAPISSRSTDELLVVHRGRLLRAMWCLST